jgi:arsenate reductase
MELWNNPSCSKCAGARSSLAAAHLPYRLRAYLEQPPTAGELADVLRRLGVPPWEICRTDEPAAIERGMGSWPRDQANEGRWIAAMVDSPELIQRPILLLDDGSAAVVRTREALADAIRRATGA